MKHLDCNLTDEEAELLSFILESTLNNHGVQNDKLCKSLKEKIKFYDLDGNSV
jgi:hypothetical protein